MRAPTELLLDCKVRGCGETFRVPVVYREVRDELDIATHGNPGAVFVTTRLEVDVEATLDLEAVVRAHLDQHATDGAPPASVYEPAPEDGLPPDPEVELTRGEVEDDEPEGWRAP